MINVLSYVGMNMQSEVCLWTLLGLMRTIFDATLFKVNSNLKQVWQMSMPGELSLPVQRVLRTVISGVMLVQCFTVYVYLASYIVLLYPVFLEERPTLVLPWLLLAAIRKLLCELTSLSLGLGTCVLVGPARPPCIKFLVVKLVSIMPAFYMWMLVFSYYNVLKVAAAFKTFPPVLPSADQDYGLELAVRRRRTKSLFGEELLRRNLEASFYNERNGGLIETEALPRLSADHNSSLVQSADPSVEDMKENIEGIPMSVTSNRMSDAGTFEDWFGNEVVIPRDTDRILEQIVLMLLRISVYLKREGCEALNWQSLTPRSHTISIRTELDCPAMSADDIDTPAAARSRSSNRPSYLRDYPELFTRRSSDKPLVGRKAGSIRTVQHRRESDAEGNVTRQYKRSVSINSNEKISLEVERVVNRKIQPPGKSSGKKESTSKPKHTLQIKEVNSDDTENYSTTETKDNGNEEDHKTRNDNLNIFKESSNNHTSSDKRTEEDMTTEENENTNETYNKIDEHFDKNKQ